MKEQNNLINQLVKISEMYWIQGLTQKEIAQKIHIDRSKISRILTQARKLGIVKISINANYQNIDKLQSFLIRTFSLNDALVVPENSEVLDLQTLGNYAAQYLEKCIINNSTIGLSWGRSLAHTIQSLPQNLDKKGTKIVPLIGGPVGRLKNDYQSNQLAFILSEKLGGRLETLNCPAIVSSAAMKRELVSNPNNKVVFENWKKLDYAIVGIGSSDLSQLSQWKEFYKSNSFNNIFKNENIIGDILSQGYTSSGKIIKNTNIHVIALNLDQLKQVPNVIGIACGRNKIKAILGALNCGLLTTLITTDTTALGIKNLYERNHICVN